MLFAISLILFGFGAGLFIEHFLISKEIEIGTTQVRNRGSFKFINPLYECEIGGQDLLKKYVPFEEKIKEKIADEIETRENIDVSVYFRNLNNGPWFGIKENENFAPASLLKVPLMIAYFKKSESDPNILGLLFKFRKQEENNLTAMQQIIPAVNLMEGESYSVEELIRRMIVYSDNEAMALLFNNLSKDDIYKIYGDLGINNPYGTNETDSLSVKDYASFYRILYNAAYLDKEHSEKALALLTETEFRDGLAGGVPNNVKVAHKFGERELSEGEFKNQFHDCGIVYYEKYPYLLCVMTRGENKNNLIEAIKDISKIVFEEVSRSYP